jgi:TolB-like protein
LPAPDEIRSALERVLASRVFGAAERAKDFLRFVVEETLANRGDRLKGYTIAVEVFERPADFDSATDPLVRVEAGRLRRRLMEYYLSEGHEDGVRIELPRGGYQPQFRYSQAAFAKSERTGLVAALHNPLVLGPSIGAVALLAAAVLLWSFGTFAPGNARDDRARTGAAARAPRLIVLPLANLSEDPALETLAAGVTEELILALVGFNIVATASPTGEPLESASLGALRKEFDARYVFTGSVRSRADGVRIAVRLIDADMGTQLWTRAFDETAEAAGAFKVQERVARTIAMLLASPFGPVFAHEIAGVAGLSPDELDPYQCLLRFYGYARSFDPAEHAASVRCMERVVRTVPEYAAAWSSLAVLYLHEHAFGYSPQIDRGPALDRALEASRTALDIEGSDRIAAITMAGIQLAAGNLEAFQRAADRALSLEPRHPAVMAQIGYHLTLAGDWERGFPLIEDAVAVTAHVPGWYYVTYAFRYLQTGDYPEALAWALRVDAPNWFLTPLTVAASAGLAGRPELAERGVERLLALYPDFAATGRARLERWQLNSNLIDLLIAGLAAAGLTVA